MGYFSFDSIGTNIEGKELSERRFEQFGNTGPWRDFAKEAIAKEIFHKMREPLVKGKKLAIGLH